MNKKSTSGSKQVEWLGGIYSTLPEVNIVKSSDIDLEQYFTDEDIESKREPAPAGSIDNEAAQETLVWMAADGTIVGKQSFAANQSAIHAVDNFWKATREPMTGPPHVPARVVISDPALAALLRKALRPAVQVVTEYSMELDDLMQFQFDLVPVDIDTSITAIAELLPPDDAA
jgi:hypothetical protein